MYKYETHLHTSAASLCASASGKFQAIAYKNAGYTGIFITDHFFRGNSCLHHINNWEDKVNAFCKGYEEAKEIGDQIGLQVFFGWEETFEGQDFLIYGLDKEWLLSHPECANWTIEEQFKTVDEAGGLVIQAHPFRDRPYIPKIRLFPTFVHGIEVYNACNREIENEQAYKFAKQYNLPITAGSDSHNHDIICSGIKVSEKLNSVEDYISLIKERKDKELIF